MGDKLIDLAGEKFCHLTVIDRANNIGEVTMWNCQCECGVVKAFASRLLRTGQSRSCGCKRFDLMREKLTGHGMSNTPTWNSWASMKARCFNPKEPSYPNYGGRGITVCDRWRDSFDNFLADMGIRPDGKTLDRFPDVNGNYEPSNCRWATPSQQARNRRSTRLITIDGVTKGASDWEDDLGIKAVTLRARIDHSGMTPEQAKDHPLWKKRRKADRGNVVLPKGESHHNSKLKTQDVLEIAAMKGKKTQIELSKQYGISKGQISHIWTGRLWSHVTGVKK